MCMRSPLDCFSDFAALFVLGSCLLPHSLHSFCIESTVDDTFPCDALIRPGDDSDSPDERVAYVGQPLPLVAGMVAYIINTWPRSAFAFLCANSLFYVPSVFFWAF